MRGNRRSGSAVARSLIGCLALATVLVVLTACGANLPTGSASTGPTSTQGAPARGSTSTTNDSTGASTTEESETETSAPQTSPTTKKSKTNVIDWILRLGVGSPTGPAFDYLAHYDALRKQDCQAALGEGDGVQVVAAAAKACLAARGSKESATLWSEATAARDGIKAGSLNCLDEVAYGLLNQLVRAHDEHPERTFRFVTGSHDQGNPQCPAITGSKPDTGSSGDVVTLKGIHLSSVDQVAVRFGEGDAQPVTPFDRTSKRIRVRMPKADGGAEATIEVTSPRLPWTMTAPFRYHGASSTPSTTPTETPSGASATSSEKTEEADHDGDSDSGG